MLLYIDFDKYIEYVGRYHYIYPLQVVIRQLNVCHCLVTSIEGPDSSLIWLDKVIWPKCQLSLLDPLLLLVLWYVD